MPKSFAEAKPLVPYDYRGTKIRDKAKMKVASIQRKLCLVKLNSMKRRRLSFRVFFDDSRKMYREMN